MKTKLNLLSLTEFDAGARLGTAALRCLAFAAVCALPILASAAAICDDGTKVGINTNNPQAAFHVVGNARVDGESIVQQLTLPSDDLQGAIGYELGIRTPERGLNRWSMTTAAPGGGYGTIPEGLNFWQASDQISLERFAIAAAYPGRTPTPMLIDGGGNLALGRARFGLGIVHIKYDPRNGVGMGLFIGDRDNSPKACIATDVNVPPAHHIVLHERGTPVFDVTSGGNTYIAGDLNAALKVTCNVLEVTSDRNAKTRFASLNLPQVLVKIVGLEITEWEYTNAPGVRHYGATAQDFHAKFGLGSDDKHINPLDAASVALAGVQALTRELEQRDEQLARKDAELAALKREVAALKQEMVAQQNVATRVAALEKLMAQCSVPRTVPARSGIKHGSTPELSSVSSTEQPLRAEDGPRSATESNPVALTAE